ncbi:hypothetical protein CLV24_102132 [Pontibacter ummariensis]|uniref:Por secretion system C-terminal sorting domain-containing protein n=1 Tax=Pontibacter ummariensis TaxID=1610492 RepID=A0A239C308_9BACT|nr:hypothetical protein [Pontibacter ummariensis]PRY15511.1 hypothetical protein CLV24_102132 [Pontibacter ummariensis]SNS13753.1 hypothetical protein SAMN06296052_102280 [Pontibacter ummariensis]
MKPKYAQFVLASLPLGLMLAFTAAAQTTPLPKQEKTHILVRADSLEETLSGIHLRPDKKGTFYLDFSQDLEEDATLQVKNKAGLVVFQQPLLLASKKNRWGYHLGRLKPDTYLVEVRTSDTTYWTKFRVSK